MKLGIIPPPLTLSRTVIGLAINIMKKLLTSTDLY